MIWNLSRPKQRKPDIQLSEEDKTWRSKDHKIGLRAKSVLRCFWECSILYLILFFEVKRLKGAWKRPVGRPKMLNCILWAKQWLLKLQVEWADRISIQCLHTFPLFLRQRSLQSSEQRDWCMCFADTWEAEAESTFIRGFTWIFPQIFSSCLLPFLPFFGPVDALLWVASKESYVSLWWSF